MSEIYKSADFLYSPTGGHESGERGDIFRDYEKSTGNTHISF